MRLMDMTWEEVDALPRDIVAVLPCGSVEQHSLHLPVRTDSLVATEIAERACVRHEADALLLPTLWLGASHHHLGFPGTLSVPPERHAAAVRDVIESLARDRFERFFVLNAHGGNEGSIGIALRGLSDAYPNLILAHAGYWLLASERFAAITTGPSKAPGHACEMETSILLALRPDLVRTDKIDDDCMELSPPLKGLNVVAGFDRRTAHGGSGYPSHASVEKGERYLAAAVDAVSEAIAALRAGVTWREAE